MAKTAGTQVTGPQSGKAGPDRDRRNELEGEEIPEANPVGMVDGPMRSHDGETAHPGSNLYPTGPGGARQDIGGDISSPELTKHQRVTPKP